MDAESIGLVKDYVNELLSYVSAFSPSRLPQLEAGSRRTQFSCDQA